MDEDHIIEIQSRDGYAIVHLFGLMNADTVERAKLVIDQGVHVDCSRIVIDLEKVILLDAHGIRLFIFLLQRVYEKEGGLVFAAARSQAADVLESAGFFKIPSMVVCYDTLSEACASLEKH